MMAKFKAWFISFMNGRYGIDRLGNVLLWTCVGLAVVNIFASSPVIYAIQTLLLIWAVFRFFSRGYEKRRAENAAFLRFFGKIKAFFKLRRDMFRDRSTHVYKKCPHCKATVRLPKSKGEHTVRCPRCSDRFTVKI
jgi:hypothetical protein